MFSKVQEYFYADQALSNTFESFVKRKASIIDLEAVEVRDEYKLVYTEAFNEFKALFEEKMESFIEKTLNSSVQRFYSVLKAKSDDDGDSNEGKFSF